MKKTGGNILLCSLVFAAVGVLLFGLYGADRNSYFWTLFVSYLCGAVITTYGICKTDRVSGDSKFIMFSVDTLAVVYWIAYGTVVWKTTKLFEMAELIYIYVAIHMLLLAVFVILVTLCVRGSSYVKQQDVKEKEQCSMHKTLQNKINEVACLYDDIEDASIKNAISQISESIRYMDPVSTNEVANEDNAIYRGLEQFGNMLENKSGFSTEEVLAKAKEIQKLIQIRNNKNKLSK